MIPEYVLMRSSTNRTNPVSVSEYRDKAVWILWGWDNTDLENEQPAQFYFKHSSNEPHVISIKKVHLLLTRRLPPRSGLVFAQVKNIATDQPQIVCSFLLSSCKDKSTFTFILHITRLTLLEKQEWNN